MPTAESEAFGGRVPPQNIEAETSVLGAIMLGEPGSVESAVEIITRDDFYRDAHGQIFDAMTGLSHRSQPVDVITLKDELERRRELENIGGISYLMQLGEFVPTTANLVYHAKIVRNKAILRRLIAVSSRIAGMAYASDLTVDEVAEAAEQEIHSVTNSALSATSTPIPLKNGVRSTRDRLDKNYHADGHIIGLQSEFFGLDLMLNGFQKGDLIIVAARPAVGKSALAANIGVNIAKAGGVVLVASLEMSEEQWHDRLVVAEARIDGSQFARGEITSEQWDAVDSATERLWDGVHYVIDTPRLSVTSLRSHCRRIKPDLVIVDYLQLMQPSEAGTRRQSTRAEEVAGIARDLKTMAREIGVPVIALAQVNRLIERREDKRPNLSDLAESGGLEANADAVLFLYRPALYATDRGASTPVHDAELIVAKNRRGRTGLVRLQFACNHARFYEQTEGD